MVRRIFIKSCEPWPKFQGKYRVFVNCEETAQVRAKCEKYHELGIFLAKFWHFQHVSSFKIDRAMPISSFKIQMSGVGLVFEARPPNFQNLHNF